MQHRKRLAQAVEQVGRGRIGKHALGIRAQHRLPVPVGLGQAGALAAGSALSPSALKPRPGGSIRPFCEPADRHVDAPFVLPVVDRGERRDGVDHEQRRMAGPVERLAYLRDARGDPGRGLVVHHAHALTTPAIVGEARRSAQDRRRASRPAAVPPRARAGAPSRTRASRNGRSPPSARARPATGY